MVKSLIFLSILCLFVGAFSFHLKLDEMKSPYQSTEVYMYIPSGEFLRPFTLGFNQILADYFWIKTVSYFADHLMSDRKYPWLYHILNLVTTLDPQFIWPYYFGGIILSLEAQQVEQSNLILMKAMRYHPGVWKFPFFLGFNYWYHSHDPLKAAAYIEIAAKLPGAPPYLKTFPARLYRGTGQKEAAIMFLEEMRKNTQDLKMRAEIEKRIKAILEGRLEPPKKPTIKFK